MPILTKIGPSATLEIQQNMNKTYHKNNKKKVNHMRCDYGGSGTAIADF